MREARKIRSETAKKTWQHHCNVKYMGSDIDARDLRLILFATCCTRLNSNREVIIPNDTEQTETAKITHYTLIRGRENSQTDNKPAVKYA